MRHETNNKGKENDMCLYKPMELKDTIALFPPENRPPPSYRAYKVMTKGMTSDRYRFAMMARFHMDGIPALEQITADEIRKSTGDEIPKHLEFHGYWGLYPNGFHVYPREEDAVWTCMQLDTTYPRGRCLLSRIGCDKVEFVPFVVVEVECQVLLACGWEKKAPYVLNKYLNDKFARVAVFRKIKIIRDVFGQGVSD